MNLSKNRKLLYDLRKEKGMTQKQVAEKIGIVPKTVSKWETENISRCINGICFSRYFSV